MPWVKTAWHDDLIPIVNKSGTAVSTAGWDGKLTIRKKNAAATLVLTLTTAGGTLQVGLATASGPSNGIQADASADDMDIPAGNYKWDFYRIIASVDHHIVGGGLQMRNRPLTQVTRSTSPYKVTPPDTNEGDVTLADLAADTLAEIASKADADSPVVTDDLSVSGSTSAIIKISGTAGNLRTIEYQTGGSLRWRVGTQTAAESGANAGSNYSIRGYDDSGTLLGTAMQITRATLNTNLFSLTLDTALAVAQGGTGATSAASARTNLGAGDASGPGSATDNAAARFDGTTGKLLQNSDLIINDDKSVTLSSVASDPSAPAADKITLFSRTQTGRAVPAFRNATDAIANLQRSFGQGRWASHVCAFGQTTVHFNGIIGPTAVGTATSASFASTNRFTQEQRIEYLVTVASTSAVAGYRTGSAINIYHRGANAGQGGFYYSTRWGPATGVTISTHRAFVGLIQSYTPTDVDPSTLVNMWGMGWDDDDANVQFMHNGASGTATKIDTGIAVPSADRTTLYQFEMYCAPNGSEIFFRLTEINTGTVFASSATTNLGANTTALSPHGYISVGGTNSVIGFAHCSLHIETV